MARSGMALVYLSPRVSYSFTAAWQGQTTWVAMGEATGLTGSQWEYQTASSEMWQVTMRGPLTLLLSLRDLPHRVVVRVKVEVGVQRD